MTRTPCQRAAGVDTARRSACATSATNLAPHGSSSFLIDSEKPGDIRVTAGGLSLLSARPKGCRTPGQGVGGKSHGCGNGGIPQLAKGRVPEKPTGEREYGQRYRHACACAEGRGGCLSTPAQHG